MKNIRKGQKVIVTVVAVAHMGLQAAPLPLAQVPQTTGVQEPAPNVIVSVDNSGSMAFSSNSDEGSNPPSGSTPTRLAALKQALLDNFSASKIPDGRIRLAWQAMNPATGGDNNCVGFVGQADAGACTYGSVSHANSMRSLEGGHRSNFFAWVNALNAAGGTPLHAMMARAGSYMQTTGQNNPYNNEPGSEAGGIASCRKTYHVFMTDGDYNLFGQSPDPSKLGMPLIGNADGLATTLPEPLLGDSSTYSPRPPFKDAAGALNSTSNWTLNVDGTWTPTKEYRPTLADMAFYYWQTDLQPSVPNNVQPIKAVTNTETIGSASVPAPWNPKNDPATWQHMVTSTIGFGAAAAWEGSPRIDRNAAQPTYSGDYAKLVDGSLAWPNPLAATLPGATPNAWWGWYGAGPAIGYWQEGTTSASQQAAVRMDLWHAALNGRGTFTPASNAAALSGAFDSILANILNSTSEPIASLSANSSSYKLGTYIYQAGYETGSWSGTLDAKSVSNVSTGALTKGWSAASVLDSQMGARQLLTSVAGQTKPFRWDDLSLSQKGALQGAAIITGADVTLGRATLDYLRGDRANEGGTMRTRKHVLGDIIGSSVWYAGKPNSGFARYAYGQFASAKAARTPMIYVGANDGMLHAFNAGTGAEAFAFVPAGVYGTPTVPLLRQLSSPTYAHRYFVDGSPFVGDVFLGSPASTDTAANATQWRSLLLGTLGAGGKGYFILDVTDPSSITEASNDLVLVDNTTGTDADIGNIVQQPVVEGSSGRAKQFTRVNTSSNSSRPAVIMGNGVNSSSEKAVLLIQYLDGARELKKIYAPSTQALGTGNGLSTPELVDRDLNGTTDYVYAGDQKGNLWKFDLSSQNSLEWKVTTGAKLPGSTATDSDVPLFQDADSRPITSAPSAVAHPYGGYMVTFGTGRNITGTDISDTTMQALFGIWDNSAGKVQLTDLAEQAFEEALVTGSDGQKYRQLKAGGAAYSTGADSRRGWYLTLTESRERVVSNAEALTSSIGVFKTLIPGTGADNATCTSGKPDEGWVLVLDLFSGNTPKIDVFDSGNVQNLGYRLTGTASTVTLRGEKAGDFKIVDASGKAKGVSTKKAGQAFGWRGRVPLE